MSMLRAARARRRAMKVRPSSRTVLANARDAADLSRPWPTKPVWSFCVFWSKAENRTELGELIGRRQAAISQQRARLRAQNLVEARRDGKNIGYSFAPPQVHEIAEALHGLSPTVKSAHRSWRSVRRIGLPRQEGRADACRTAMAAKLRRGRAVRLGSRLACRSEKVVARRVQFAAGPSE